jgi:Fe-S cluster biogenesis protein NfuA
MYDGTDAPREESERIQLLLDEVRELAPPPAWQRVEELIQRLVALYGEGLKRLLMHARECGADGTLSDRLAGDDLVSSLLLLHDLHPLDTEGRVRNAIERLRPHLAERGARLELIGIADGIARVRFAGGSGCGSAALQQLVHRTIEEAAPELTSVELEEPAAQLVPLRMSGASR